MKENRTTPETVAGTGRFSYTRLLQEDLLARIEARLVEIPNHVELQVERSHLLAELDRAKEAAEAYRAATKATTPKYPLTSRAYSVLPYRGEAPPITVLLLVSPAWGNAPFRRYLDDRIFLALQVITDFHEPGLALPPHQLVVNCISEADSCPASLQAAFTMLANDAAPVVNPPSAVLATSRENNARRFAGVPGLRTPKTATFSRGFLAAPDATEALAQLGFGFPLLLRAPGFHTGQHLERVDSAKDLGAVLPALPEDNISAIEFLEARGTDGLARKFRVMMIGGDLYPAHLAVSRDWKIHYFSSAMADAPEFRQEEKRFLQDMPGVLGERAMGTLERIRDTLQLDYAGIDFGLGAEGEILLFEANATMNIRPPENDEMWGYRRTPVQRIDEAIRGMLLKRAQSNPTAATAWPAHALKEFSLRQLEARLEREPGLVDLQIERARLLIDMERYDEAKQIYLGILTKDPTQFVALNNLASLFNIMGYHGAALRISREVVKLQPDNLRARLNLANNLRAAAELEEARTQFEELLRIAPELAEAHLGLAFVLMYLGEEKAAREHEVKAAEKRLPIKFPERNEKNLTRVIILASPCGGNSPVFRLADRRLLQPLRIFGEFHPEATPLPPHQLIVNTIGDADHCETSLRAVERVLAQTPKLGPILNAPGRIRMTGRAENARILRHLEGVVTPKIVTLAREILSGPNAVEALEREGLTFPLLLRAPGFHGGSYFRRVETPGGLAEAVAALPGKSLMAIEFLDARDADGKIRKYRVMMIDGKLHPLHKAISREWMIHYFSAEMAQSPEHRSEDQAFLEDMAGDLGARAIAALERIQKTLGLDYAGADFSLNRHGNVLLFETNATMVVPFPEKDEKWKYRLGPTEQIRDAVRKMIRTRAAAALVGGD